jgi:hypothetical protein
MIADSHTLVVEVDPVELGGQLISNPEQGTWKIHHAPNAKIYLHDSVGIEAAMKLFIWEDLEVSNLAQVKVTSNQNGRVVGVVVRSY